MAIQTTCSGCGRNLSVADEHAGKQARCPACGQIYTIPLPAEDAPQALQSAADEPRMSPNLADTTAGPTGPATQESVQQFWMRAGDGTQYGPVDQTTLARWFEEGRVGENYQIRQGESGTWQPAEVFRPRSISGSNPYADNPYQRRTAAGPAVNYPKADQSGVILAMGILSFIVCPILGIVAWVMGSTALKDIQAGHVDPRNKGMVQVGYYLGIAGVVLGVLCLGGYLAAFVVVMVSGGM